ncbi:MAG: type II secretion system F family protein [Methanobrevibacter thaueri]|nr:type II secretion system F family protein [Methanobrevibacter thaueri]
MLENIFITIGDATLTIINLIKNPPIKSKPKEKPNATYKKQTTKTEILRKQLLTYMSNRKTIYLLIIGLTILILTTSPEISGIYIVTIIMTYIFLKHYPQIKEQREYSDLNHELPYALRHMSIELKSGKGLHDTLLTIRNANYGSLSKEFNRVLEEIKFGETTEKALIEMTHRVKSEGLTRSIHQIIGTLRVGGNLANSLEIIAKDISFDMQIKLKEFSQKLNSFILIYTFIAILAPVISLIMLMAGSTVMGDVVSSGLMFMIYGIFFPLIVVFMGVLIKRFEPKI